MGLLDLFFPKYCVNCRKVGSYLCPNCFSYLSFDTKKMCVVCNKSSINGLTHPGCKGKYIIDGSFSAISYNPIAKKLLYQFKYKPYLSDLRTVLCELMEESLMQNEEFNKALQHNPIITFIPLHSSKEKERGYNQVELLAKDLGKKLKLPVQNLLKRTRKTKPQFGLKREERRKNLRGAFAIRDKQPIRQAQGKQAIRNKTVFLIDDVLTTGSTLLEASNVLKRGGAKEVYGVTLAID